MNILIAPNAFKNSLTAKDAAKAIAEGLAQSALQCNCELFPVADGGDGTGGLIVEKLKGTLVNTIVHDALGRDIASSFGLIDDGKTAVIEMANAAGMRLLAPNELNPMRASSFGTGQMIKQALNKSVSKIIFGMGGSATVDGGVGILSALGIRFLDAEGNELKPIPQDLKRLASVDLSALDKRALAVEIVILCDVSNKLLGDDGAAAVFGPQKGATSDDIVELEGVLTRLTEITLQKTGIDIASLQHGGTAGGAAAGLHAYLKAKLVSGADSFLQLTGFNKALQNAHLVITGEGGIDQQTLQGKAPAVVARWVKEHNLPVYALAGNIPEGEDEELNKLFDKILSINKQPADTQTALKNTYKNLVNTARDIGDELHA